MTIQKRTIALFAAAALFSAAYICAARLPLEAQLHLRPDWLLDTTVTDAGRVSGELLPYKTGQAIGYFTSGGRIVSRFPYSFDAAISPFYCAPYTQDARDTVFYDRSGKQAGHIGGSGFPYFDEERIFLFHPGGASFSQCNGDGSTRWTHEGYAPIIAFASSPGGCAAGRADGTVRVFSPDGTHTGDVVPGKDADQIILGTALSDSGDLIATLSGVNPQRIALTSLKNGLTYEVFGEKLAASGNERALVKFNAANSVVYFCYAGGIAVHDRATDKTAHIPVRGTVLSMQEIPSEKLVALLAKDEAAPDGKAYTVLLFKEYRQFIGSFSFAARNAFIRASDAGDSGEERGALYVGADSTVSKIAVAER
jgi:hypothetical protein